MKAFRIMRGLGAGLLVGSALANGMYVVAIGVTLVWFALISLDYEKEETCDR